MPIPTLNPDTIIDLATRQIVIPLLNIIEAQAADITALRAENQQLRDENARLKGGYGKPDLKPSVKSSPHDHSSESERQTRTPRGKPKKNATLTVTHEERCVVDPATLPPDAVRHGTRDTIVQRLHIAVEVVRFVHIVWHVPSTAMTITAPLPSGYRRGGCPTTPAMVLALGHGANVSQPALLCFLRDVGVQIGTGTVARMLLGADGTWADEAAAVHQTGLTTTGSWVATDHTSARVDGQHEVCHVVGNVWFTSYHTRPGGTRQDVLAVLWGQELRFRLNDEELAWLQAGCPPQALLRRVCAALPRDTDMTAAEFQQHLTTAGVTLNRQQQQVEDALAVAAYHAQTQVPVRGWLLRDDAPVSDQLTATHALCGVHDWRHYAKLAPRVPHHQAELTAFGTRSWAFYHDLLAYQRAPAAAERLWLEEAFDALVEEGTTYAVLDDRVIKTADKRAQWLTVLQHPDIPLHTNDMELAARRRVRKRDVSFGPQSRNGARAWGSFQTLAATAAQRGVGFFHYLRDRMVTPATTPPLAERVAQRAGVAVPSAA